MKQRVFQLSLSVLRMQMLPIDIDACTEEEAFQAPAAPGGPWMVQGSIANIRSLVPSGND